MRETQIENALVREVEKLGAKAIKFEVPGKRGMPDRIILIPGGQTIFTEVKAPGEKLRPLQEKRIRDLQKLGFQTFIVNSLEKVEEVVEVIKCQKRSSHMTTKNIR